MADTQPKILVVDDRQENIFAMKAVLNRLDVKVVCAASGEEALKLCLEDEYCLAIVDVQMPGMDGYELVELIRSNMNTSALPVIFVSAIYSDEYHYRKGYDAGAVDFLSKPVNTDILISKVKVFIQLWQQKIELQNLINRLNDWNSYLENTVRERTETVKTVNATLTSQIKFQDELFTTAAGELASSLAALHSPLSTLQGALKNRPGEQDALKKTLASAGSFHEIIACLADAPKISEQMLNLSRKPASLPEIIASACDACHDLLEEHNLAVVVEKLNKLPSIEVDVPLSRLLFRQLILHAIYHTQEGSAVTITGECTPAGGIKPMEGEALRVNLAFQGLALDPGYRQWVSAVLPQPGQTTATEKPRTQRGSALGLLLAPRIVEAHAGQLWVEEKGPAGVIFHVALPV